MKEIDVFLDLESIGVGHLPFGDSITAKVLLNRLPDFLKSNGYTIKNLWGTACVRRHKRNLPGHLQVTVKNILTSHGGIMFWTKKIADEALKEEVQRRLEQNDICPTVLLVADDHGFTPLANQLKESGREVIVTGRHVSRQLVCVANRTIPLEEILGEDKEYRPAPLSAPFNGIDLPKLP